MNTKIELNYKGVNYTLEYAAPNSKHRKLPTASSMTAITPHHYTATSRRLNATS